MDAIKKKLSKTRKKSKDKRPVYNSALIYLYAKYRWQAGKRNLKFAIKKGAFLKKVTSPCFYCAAPPHRFIARGNGMLRYNGLDRISSGRGYEAGNLVPCCFTCNSMKSDRPLEDFILQVATIAKNFLGMR